MRFVHKRGMVVVGILAAMAFGFLLTTVLLASTLSRQGRVATGEATVSRLP